MMLADAIDSAVSEHAVYFLVTAYLESLHHFHTSSRIPEPVIALPLGGVDDLRRRTQMLRETGNGASGNVTAAAAKASAILEGALARLRQLGQAPDAGIDTLGASRKAA